MNQSIQINRNPFARESLHREIHLIYNATHQSKSCDWCGTQGKQVKGGLYTRLFKYSLVPDAGRINYITGSFCSVGCMRDYHFQ